MKSQPNLTAVAVETTALRPAAVCVSPVGRESTALSQNAQTFARIKAVVKTASVSASRASEVRTAASSCALWIAVRMESASTELASVRRALSVRTAV